MFDVKVGKNLSEDEFEFVRCAEKLFPEPETNKIGDKTKQLCRISLNNEFPVGLGVAGLRCYVAKSNLFHFNVEELWLDKSVAIGVHLVPDFLSPRDLEEFEPFRDRVSFHHMAKFYDVYDESDDTGA